MLEWIISSRWTFIRKRFKAFLTFQWTIFVLVHSFYNTSHKMWVWIRASSLTYISANSRHDSISFESIERKTTTLRTRIHIPIILSCFTDSRLQRLGDCGTYSGANTESVIVCKKTLYRDGGDSCKGCGWRGKFSDLFSYDRENVLFWYLFFLSNDFESYHSHEHL